jgi:hypothetical protein
MKEGEPQGVLREGVAAMRLMGIVYASGLLHLTSERLEWRPFPFFQWFWRLSGILLRTPVPHKLTIEISRIASVDRGERLRIGAGPILERPLVVASDGQTYTFFIGVSIFDEAEDWMNDMRGMLGTAKP